MQVSVGLVSLECSGEVQRGIQHLAVMAQHKNKKKPSPQPGGICRSLEPRASGDGAGWFWVRGGSSG